MALFFAWSGLPRVPAAGDMHRQPTSVASVREMVLTLLALGEKNPVTSAGTELPLLYWFNACTIPNKLENFTKR